MTVMAKKKYSTPLWVDDQGDVVIEFGGSQGTIGEDSQFTWDPAIDPNDINMFWLSYDETDLAFIDGNDDLYISKDEFDTWYNTEKPW